ncbi:uncharacterized protein A4U43_C01F19560 [Asparagus officinalis]|uniref:Uncharacterized protein n=1 Tax=Asparagus officinalis TaxID=4686 RepID=A0A5P1FSE7_ASPOF|nr:uncharacterized protein A4U43_C01F19560 [Asparagus officinalis]
MILMELEVKPVEFRQVWGVATDENPDGEAEVTKVLMKTRFGDEESRFKEGSRGKRPRHSKLKAKGVNQRRPRENTRECEGSVGEKEESRA